LVTKKESEMSDLTDKNSLEEVKNKSYYSNLDIKYFYENEIKTILEGIESENEFYTILIQFLFETAARINEGRNIRYLDIDFKNNVVQIQTSKQRSNIRNRILQISDNLAKN